MKKGHLHIYGTIGQPDAFLEAFGADNNVSASWVKEQLAQITEEEVEVHITSNGGSVSEGYAIHDILKASGKKITTLGEGYVRSIATVIFLAGSKRLISPNADFTIHNPFIDLSFTSGLEASDIAKIASDVQQQEDKLAQFYSDATGKPLDDIKAKMKVETTLSAQEVIDFGFATGKVEQTKALAFINNNTNTQIKMSQEIKKELTGLKAIVNTLVAKFKGEIKAMTLTLKDGVEKAMTDSDAAIAVGQKVTKEDGTLFEAGDITLEDDTVITLDAEGVITAILETEDKAGEGAEAAALKVENTELKAEIQKLKTENSAVQNDIAELKATVSELATLSSKYKAKPEAAAFKKTAASQAAVVENAVTAARAARAAREAAKK
jgi:ATP-dependent protease ClpP protease subunit